MEGRPSNVPAPSFMSYHRKYLNVLDHASGYMYSSDPTEATGILPRHPNCNPLLGPVQQQVMRVDPLQYSPILIENA